MYKTSLLTYLCNIVCRIPTCKLQRGSSCFAKTGVPCVEVLNPGLENQKKCPFPLHRGVPSKEVNYRYKDYVDIFPGPNFVSLAELFLD